MPTNSLSLVPPLTDAERAAVQARHAEAIAAHNAAVEVRWAELRAPYDVLTLARRKRGLWLHSNDGGTAA